MDHPRALPLVADSERLAGRDQIRVVYPVPVGVPEDGPLAGTAEDPMCDLAQGIPMPDRDSQGHGLSSREPGVRLRVVDDGDRSELSYLRSLWGLGTCIAHCR